MVSLFLVYFLFNMIFEEIATPLKASLNWPPFSSNKSSIFPLLFISLSFTTNNNPCNTTTGAFSRQIFAWSKLVLTNFNLSFVCHESSWWFCHHKYTCHWCHTNVNCDSFPAQPFIVSIALGQLSNKLQPSYAMVTLPTVLVSYNK